MKKYPVAFAFLLASLFPVNLAKADSPYHYITVTIMNRTSIKWDMFAQVFQGSYDRFPLGPHKGVTHQYTTPDHATILEVSINHKNPNYFFQCLKGFDPRTTTVANVIFYKVPGDPDPYQCSMNFVNL